MTWSQKQNQADTLNYLTGFVRESKLCFKVTLHYDEFQRHTSDYRINYIDILPNPDFKSIPIYETPESTSKVVGYWEIDKYACVKKRLKNNWIAADFYKTAIANEKGLIGNIKMVKLNVIKGYVRI